MILNEARTDFYQKKKNLWSFNKSETIFGSSLLLGKIPASHCFFSSDQRLC